MPLASIPRQLIEAVLTTEDRRFYDHPGVDPIGILRAFVTNLREDRSYLVGGSTLTQQIVKNTFLTPAQTLRRKVQEQFMALVLESRFTKDQILELYLNDIVMGQRGPFAIHGIPEAARVFFGKDVRNVTLAEAATLAGIIQTPSRFSPLRNPERARERRNVVLAGMAEAGVIPADDAKSAQGEPLIVASRAFDNEAPYFVDYVSSLIDEKYGGLLKRDAAVDIYTTLDVHLQRLAQEALVEGMAQVDKQLAARKRRGQAQAALIAVDPRTGEILALVGGRAYSSSQYNRAILARRQPGSVFKPFVYLAAFESMAEEGRADLTPASIVVDEPTVFQDGDKEYAPANYQDEYDGPITLRRALAHSRNVATVKVAETVGFDRVAALWKRTGVGATARAFPSIALGVFEVTPLEMTEAYTLFTNGGSVRPLQAVSRIVLDGKTRADRDTCHSFGRPPGCHLPRHEHDAERAEFRHGRWRASAGLCPRRRGQDRHDERPAGRLVHRVHPRAAHGGLGGFRRQPAYWVERVAGRAPDVDGVHEAGAGWAAQHQVRGARRHRVRLHRRGDRTAGHSELPAGRERVVHYRNGPHQVLRGPRRRVSGRSCRGSVDFSGG